jgi:hypothetical protein
MTRTAAQGQPETRHEIGVAAALPQVRTFRGKPGTTYRGAAACQNEGRLPMRTMRAGAALAAPACDAMLPVLPG